jgi:hypothetical protein
MNPRKLTSHTQVLNQGGTGIVCSEGLQALYHHIHEHIGRKKKRPRYPGTVQPRYCSVHLYTTSLLWSHQLRPITCTCPPFIYPMLCHYRSMQDSGTRRTQETLSL